MKTITCIAFTFFLSTGFGQIKELKPDQGEKKEAKKSSILKCRDPRFRMIPDCNGLVYADQDQDGVIMHQKTGKPFTGSCKVCHMNGNLEMFLTYQGGWSVGSDTVYYSNGKTQLIRNHDPEGTGKEHGVWKLYRADGSLKWEKNYEMGAPQGEFRYYFPDSSLQKIETWQDGQLHGKKQEFYPNNSLKKEIMYANGEWNGKYITYFENGMVESEQEFKNGKKEGLSRYYYNDGAIFYEESHENGCREGEFRRFYPTDERKWTVENYKDNMRDGVFEEYYDTEKNLLKFKAVYKKGELIEQHFYDEFGDETAAPEKGSPFATSEEKKQAEQWPENPTDEWLKEKKVSRKQYEKYRKKYLKNKKKQKKKQQKTGPRC